MQVPKQFHFETFYFAEPFVISIKPLPFMRLLVLGMGWTPVAFHALLLVAEMNIGIGLQVIHQMNRIPPHPGGIGVLKLILQQINVVNQHQVLMV